MLELKKSSPGSRLPCLASPPLNPAFSGNHLTLSDGHVFNVFHVHLKSPPRRIKLKCTSEPSLFIIYNTLLQRNGTGTSLLFNSASTFYVPS